jgi:CRISPR/Cas system-associated endoribonuclease Cas2
MFLIVVWIWSNEQRRRVILSCDEWATNWIQNSLIDVASVALVVLISWNEAKWAKQIVDVISNTEFNSISNVGSTWPSFLIFMLF